MISRTLRKTDLNLFIVFATIYEERSITRAAEALNVTQPAVSNNIARLRELFGDPLFVRARQGVAPTPLAHELIGPVREALQTLDHTFREHEQFDPRTSQRTLCVSMGDLAEVVFLTPLAAAINEMGSSIVVQNLQVPPQEIHSKLASGELDFAVEYQSLNEDNLNRSLLLRDDWVCVIHRRHSAIKSRFGMHDYLALNHMHISSRPRTSGMVDGALAELKQQRRIAVRVQHCLVAEPLLRNSDLCLTTPYTFVEHCLTKEDFEIFPVPFEMPPLELWLYWHSISERSMAHTWVRNLIMNVGRPPAANP